VTDNQENDKIEAKTRNEHGNGKSVMNSKIKSKKAAKYVRDFKSLAKEADKSLAKHKALEYEIERLLGAVVSQDIMYIVQNPSVLAYIDMQNQIEGLQAQLGDLKGKSSDTQCASNTLDPVFQKLEDENVIPNVGESNALSKPFTSNSVPSTRESTAIKNDKVIAPRMFRINPFKTSREENVPIKPFTVSVRTKPITVSQPSFIHKENVNPNLNGSSSTGVDNTAKTIRPQPRSNKRNDRVPSASKSSGIKNKEVQVYEHHRNLLLYKNKRHMSSECNNIKLAIQNDKSKVVCAMFKKPKKVGSKGRLASPTPSEPSPCLRSSPTGRIFDYNGKTNPRISECQSDNSNGDNACSSSPQEPTSKRFPNSTFFGRNYHIAVILGYGDLQWGNILIRRVYFVEGLGHNLFSVRQFYDLDLEVAF
ncbi:hypothetical protein Tco_0812680, partial [Tanacetum coccineum]